MVEIKSTFVLQTGEELSKNLPFHEMFAIIVRSSRSRRSRLPLIITIVTLFDPTVRENVGLKIR